MTLLDQIEASNLGFIGLSNRCRVQKQIHRRQRVVVYAGIGRNPVQLGLQGVAQPLRTRGAKECFQCLCRVLQGLGRQWLVAVQVLQKPLACHHRWGIRMLCHIEPRVFHQRALRLATQRHWPGQRATKVAQWVFHGAVEHRVGQRGQGKMAVGHLQPVVGDEVFKRRCGVYLRGVG